MKLLHVADLHLGIQVFGFSMVEEQAFILKQILETAREETVDAILVCGDVYDRSLPGVEAVNLLDHFLAEAPCPVLMISGNHDSPERVGYGASLFQKQGIHVQGRPRKPLPYVVLHDAEGPVEFYLLPFVRPEMLRGAEGFEGRTHQDAVKWMLSEMPVPNGARRVLLAHQNVVAGDEVRSAEEGANVGGLDAVGASVFDGFDYVALGHIHERYRVDQDPDRAVIWYAGSPLPYEFGRPSERGGLLVELGAGGHVEVRPVNFKGIHEWRQIRGPLEALISPEITSQADTEDYISAILTDEEVYEARERLVSVYPNLMQIGFDNLRTQQAEGAAGLTELPSMDSLDVLFAQFYEKQNGASLEEEDLALIRQILEAVES